MIFVAAEEATVMFFVKGVCRLHLVVRQLLFVHPNQQRIVDYFVLREKKRVFFDNIEDLSAPDWPHPKLFIHIQKIAVFQSLSAIMTFSSLSPVK